MDTKIENRKILIIETAERINNFVDCDVIADGINKLSQADSLEKIINCAIDLKCYIIFKTGNTKSSDFIEDTINELSSYHVKNLINQ